jgi:hypothetical protein
MFNTKPTLISFCVTKTFSNASKCNTEWEEQNQIRRRDTTELRLLR